MIPRSAGQVRWVISRFENEIKSHPNHGVVYVHRQRRLKCFGKLANNSKPIENISKWRWPFVDLQFMNRLTSITETEDSIIEKLVAIQDFSSTDFLVSFSFQSVLYENNSFPPPPCSTRQVIFFH